MDCINLKACDNLFNMVEVGKKGCPGLNTLGYIPFVSTLSAAARALYAKAQIITGLVISVLLLIQSVCTQNNRKANLLQADAAHAFKYCLHGIANIFRACIEALPLGGLFIALPYDKCLHLRYEYPSAPILPTTAPAV